jgi:LacI family transcriptional regulator
MLARMGNRLQGRPPTIRDIAREAGVSVATISRVLNRQPHVAPETRAAVLRVVREQGFSQNRSARALSGAPTGLVGVTLPFIRASYFALITAALAEALHEQDMRPIICPTLGEHDREVGLLERLMRGTTDGGVLILPSESNDELRELSEHGYPFVVLDPRVPLDEHIPTVSSANTAGAIDATEHLLRLGHRRIAAITGPAGWCATEERLIGYRGALTRAGIPLDPALEIESNFEIGGGYEAAERLLDSPSPPTAIFAFNDNLAVGVLQAARLRGLGVPADLSLVGFDDSEHAPLVTPPLTSVRQPLTEMGRMAVTLLVRLLAQRGAETLKVELSTILVVRDSTAAPPAA